MGHRVSRWVRGAGRPVPREALVELRERLVAGETWRSIEASMGMSHQTIARKLNDAGGMPPRWTARSCHQLSVSDREEIRVGLDAGESFAAIGRRLGRATSTISREVRRNGGRDAYRAWRADRRACALAGRPRASKLVVNARLRSEVEARLEQRCSPQQIAGRLRVDFPNDPEMWVSHETIYQCLFVQTRGRFRRELTAYLRTGRTRRKPRATSSTRQRSKLVGMISISERPAEADDRAVPGHWEGDLILGGHGQTAIVTLVERSSRYVLLGRLEGSHDAETTAAAITELIGRLPAHLRRSLTWDQGSEMARHAEFSVATDVAVYFCDPHSPWQRGSNENTNGLLRQYFPKGTDLSPYGQADLDTVADELNRRPRQTLQWLTPSEKLAEFVAAAA